MSTNVLNFKLKMKEDIIIHPAVNIGKTNKLMQKITDKTTILSRKEVKESLEDNKLCRTRPYLYDDDLEYCSCEIMNAIFSL